VSSPRARRASGTSRPLISLLAVPGHQPSALAVAATLEPRSFASDEGGNNRKPNHEAAPAHQSCSSSTWQIVVLEFLGLITLAVSASASRSIPTGTAGPHFHSLGRGRYQGEKRSGGGDMSIEPGWV